MFSKKSRSIIEPVPPLSERIFRSLSYLLLSCGAVWAVFGKLPQSLSTVTDPWQIVAFAFFLFLSIIASVATLRGRFYVEYGILPFSVAALLIYEIGMIFIVVSGDNEGSGLAMFLIAALICKYVSRFMSLHQLVFRSVRLRRLKDNLENSLEDHV
ncbi:hypothetical protein ACP6NG_17975 [Brevibacterium casei]|uniref:hypothetical protein n=1 Tax=Brevibacterium casei TaxID=33889 RepID=UPI003F80DECA